ncbi:uncharacterized protein LOC106663317 [Cimex lectularius]|uniref:PDZ domain-containing protein n=1 Tax=Cimex lectularius TaxID=79782 RepID=A0A8I6RCL1_CIMLE|nr:uncharacterized protein LOC106663317 [Cimex lectularius]XP_014243542.1 uncharacterized protein LOC106663317 [Cimex lectularius]
MEEVLEIKHNRQQSHDSGTYQDWPHEEQKETNYNSNVTGEFVTVVAVDTNEVPEKPFVTVVSIDSAVGIANNAEEVLVYRLPGERLGFGLKFEGGLQSSEKVSRLFIQSCADDSPASRTTASWGPITPGDEILAIDGELVTDMTRMDCVRVLKESNVVIKLIMLPGKEKPEPRPKEEEVQAPPIPPRKFPRKKDMPDPPQGFDDKKTSPPIIPRSRFNVPQAEVYTDLISQELPLPTESESDDTGSSISTVVSRHCCTPTTSNSSFSDARSITSMDIPSPPSPTVQNTPFDLDKVLEPFLQLEREFSSTTICGNNMFTNMVKVIDQKEESTLKPPENFQDADKETPPVVDAPELPPKPSPRVEIDKKFSSGKKRPPPPPPPPRNDRPVCPDPYGAQNSSHLPRLIDFVPKDRTDVVIPCPLHPSTRCDATDSKQEATKDAEAGQEEEPTEKRPSESEWEECAFPNRTMEQDPVPVEETTFADKMLSKGPSDQISVPPRLPPDGHEFPVHYDEIPTRRRERPQGKIQFSPKMEKRHSFKGNPPVTRKTSLPSADSFKHGLWRNDEKSEKSVRDKIAMFSTAASNQEKTCPPQPAPVVSSYVKLNKFKSTDDVSHKSAAYKVPLSDMKNNDGTKNGQIKKGMLPYRSLLDVTGNSFEDSKSKFEQTESNKRTQSTTDLTCGFLECEPVSTGVEYSTLPRKSDAKPTGFDKRNSVQTPTLSRAVSFSGSTKLHPRSQSLVDVGVRPPLLNSKSTEEARKSSLNHLIEQRKKSMSKLRGLVIPEKVPEVPTTQFVIDLPEIKSKDCQISTDLPIDKPNLDKKCRDVIYSNTDVTTSATLPNKPITAIGVPPWKGENSYDLPKYSPAFKRKSLALYYGLPSSVSSVSSSLSSSREELRSFNEVGKNGNVPQGRVNISTNSPQNQSEPKSLESITSPSISDLSFEYVSNSPNLKGSNDKLKYEYSSKIKNNYEMRSPEEESDNDSAVSSSRSSISHGYSPPHSPMPGLNRTENANNFINHHGNGLILKRTLSSETTASTSSIGSTLTSGSQASCSSVSSSSSVDSRRVLKPQSVEAINRKNVLSSAKFSSGLDLKVGLPPMQKVQIADGKTNTELANELTGLHTKSSGKIDDKLPQERMSNGETLEIKIVSEQIIVEDTSINEDCLKASDSSFGESFIPIENNINNDKSENDVCILNNNNNNTNNNNFTLQSPEPFVEKGSFDSLDGNKLIETSEWPEKENETINKQTLENGTHKISETKMTKTAKSLLNQKPVNVNSMKKVFEKIDNFSVPNGRLKTSNSAANVLIQHPRVSSIDSTTSDDSYVPTTTPYGSITNLQKEQQFGSITSLASSTSLISQQELSQLIEEANHTLEDGGNAHEVVVVILHRDNPGGSIGITLAGGADYEAKEITVHKVLVGSPAERDGRIQKGDRILSINGKSMKGLTHYESLAILKAPRPEVVLVVSRHKVETPDESSLNRSTMNNIRMSRQLDTKYTSPIIEKGLELKWGPVATVVLNKDGAGLGFSLEGGKDSPFGDQPLTVKKIFTGGCAEKCGQLFAGDELISVNNIDLSELSRIEAWALMKRLPDGKVHLNIRHPIS